MNFKNLIESDTPAELISEVAGMKRLGSNYKVGIPTKPQSIKRGAIIVMADDSDSDYRYEKYLVIKNNPTKKYIIIYDKDEDAIKALDNPSMKFVLGYTVNSPNLDQANKVLRAKKEEIKRVERNYEVYLVNFSKEDRDFLFL